MHYSAPGHWTGWVAAHPRCGHPHRGREFSGSAATLGVGGVQGQAIPGPRSLEWGIAWARSPKRASQTLENGRESKEAKLASLPMRGRRAC